MDRKTETKRLMIYLAFAFGITWVIFFAYILSGNIWAADGEISAMDQFVCLGMLCPALAVLLTRYVTREGFAVTGEDSMLLGISFKDKKWLCFVIAMFLPWLYFELGNVLTLIISPNAFDINNPELLELADNERTIIFIQPIAAIVSGVIASFAAFGEEAGWRGYMMPKMIKLWGVKKAVVIGGILWGIWHWPLTYVGHNFGTEYFGYPFTGFAAMCVMCVFMGIILTFVTYKSGSIWPATILHAVNNGSPSILQYFINNKKVGGWRSDSMVSFLIYFLPMMIIGGFLLVKGDMYSEIKEHFDRG
ncbi:MAG: CPBP family intramembrane metalloprotease [Lachnospiraceae bacterium]|nr:CPBP family intramembrane metalloprotease [Lachnospiraceae bacterium]